MRILLTGATGFVGGALFECLQQIPETSVRAVLRRRDDSPTDIDSIQIPDISAETDWRIALSEVDCVIHAAARVHVMQDTAESPLVEFRRVNVGGTLNLARQAASLGVKRFVFVSSVKVNGEGTMPGKPFYADDPSSPLDPYAISKYEAETGLRKIERETGMEVVILRPPLVYGPGVKANFLRLMDLAQKGLPLPLGLVSNRRSVVFVGNLVSAIMVCLKHPGAAGETFLVSDGGDVSTPDLIRKVASAMGRKATFLPVPLGLLRALGSLLGKRAEIERLSSSLCVDSVKIRKVLDWQAPYTLDQGIQETVDWYLGQG